MRRDGRLDHEQLRHRHLGTGGGLDVDRERDRARGRIDGHLGASTDGDRDAPDVHVLRSVAAAADHRIDDVGAGRERIEGERAVGAGDNEEVRADRAERVRDHHGVPERLAVARDRTFEPGGLLKHELERRAVGARREAEARAAADVGLAGDDRDRRGREALEREPAVGVGLGVLRANALVGNVQLGATPREQHARGDLGLRDRHARAVEHAARDRAAGRHGDRAGVRGLALDDGHLLGLAREEAAAIDHERVRPRHRGHRERAVLRRERRRRARPERHGERHRHFAIGERDLARDVTIAGHDDLQRRAVRFGEGHGGELERRLRLTGPRRADLVLTVG